MPRQTAAYGTSQENCNTIEVTHGKEKGTDPFWRAPCGPSGKGVCPLSTAEDAKNVAVFFETVHTFAAVEPSLAIPGPARLTERTLDEGVGVAGDDAFLVRGNDEHAESRLFADWISPSSPIVAAFRWGSISRPSWPRSSQHLARTAGAFSPIPPVKTTASTVPRTAVYMPMYFLTR